MQKTTKDSHLLEQYDQSINLYKSFVSEIEHLITKILETNGINCNAIVSRTKSRESFVEKIERKGGKYTDLCQITDIAGVRIITYYSEDVDKITKIIETEFDVDQENSIDKRESLEPDRFGYCSVHYVVKMSPQRLSLCEYSIFKDLKCEIQIRSVLQHAWAEIEHDIGYKSEIAIPKQMRRDFSRIAGLLEIADKEFNQIRSALKDYKKCAQVQIEESTFLDSELDSVLLEVMIDSNTIVHQINHHISNLISNPLDHHKDPDDYSMTISQLNWLGIKTVKQLNEALITYSEQAKVIASEKLKHHSSKSTGIMFQTAAFFYLCYAILLANDCDAQKISAYLKENHIGSIKDHPGTINELLRIKEII